MTTRIATIFPDTNLFIQCHPLGDLDWSSWAEYDELHLLVCRSVQRELDSLKIHRKNRVAHKARKACKILKTLITDENDHLVNSERPLVKLKLAVPGLPSRDPKLMEMLDYSKPDDELIGYAYCYSQEHPGTEVIILTHDTGPMGTAREVGIECRDIPNEWLIGSQQNSEDPEITRLKARINELEREEPRFELQAINSEGKHTDKLEIEYPTHGPMAQSEIDACMQTIRNCFPMETEFGSREPEEHETKKRDVTSPFGHVPTGGALAAITRRTYEPVTDEQISRYQDVDYPRWLSDCESILINLHAALQAKVPRPEFVIEASNIGTKPAQDTLITFTAQGGFQICAESCSDTLEAEEQKDPVEGFPQPPQAPAGRWTSVLTSSIPRFGEAFRNLDIPYIGDLPPHRRDPNRFHYKPSRPTEPTDSFSLECAQWRHRTEAEDFRGFIDVDPSMEEINGAIRCEIHAGNLAKPVRWTVPICIRRKMISVEPTSHEMLRRLQESSTGT